MAIDRHRDKNGEISRKHGNTLIRRLRMTYGSGFAAGCANDATLSDVLANLDETSLRYIILDHEAGYLEQICRAA
jgi:CO dehydrogenase nickel-insertion accessory protein CooC1